MAKVAIVVHPDWHYESAHFAQTMVDKFVDFFLDCLEENDKLKVILTNMDEWSYQELSKTLRSRVFFFQKHLLRNEENYFEIV